MSQDNIAVRVNNISKIYQLRRDPGEMGLSSLFKRIVTFFLPTKKNKKPFSRFQEFHALKNITFEIKKGESWGFIGVNGSGKSTLLKIISGNVRPSAGYAEVDGKVVILNYGSGFNGEFTGKENIYMKATLLGLTKKQINERFQSIVEFAELGDFINQPVKTYSSGMVSRLGFAIIAHVDADIIISDEALAVGDVFFVQKCMHFIREFLKKGTFLFVSHSTNDVISLCQNAMWLEHGVIKAIGSPSQVTQAYLDKAHLDAASNSIETTNDLLPETSALEKSEVALAQPELSSMMQYEFHSAFKDIRWHEINHSHLRNDIQILSNQLTSSSGVGGVKIVNVTLTDANNENLAWVVGGVMVTLNIEVLAERELRRPMVGFQVKHSSGQVIFADNSYSVIQKQSLLVRAGTLFVAEFTFQMPILPIGKYDVRAAVAVGEDEGNAILLQTMDNALIFNSSSSYIKQGLLGIPVRSITQSSAGVHTAIPA